MGNLWETDFLTLRQHALKMVWESDGKVEMVTLRYTTLRMRWEKSCVSTVAFLFHVCVSIDVHSLVRYWTANRKKLLVWETYGKRMGN